MKNVVKIASGLLVGALSLTACGSGAASSPAASTTTPTLSVVGEVYALAWVAERVGGDRAEVTQLVPSGASVHGYELAPAEVTRVGEADLFITVSGVASAVDEALEETHPGSTIDLAAILPTRPAVAHSHADEDATEHEGEHTHENETDHDHEGDHDEDAGGIDTHLWLNPASMPTLVTAVADQMSALDADGATTYATNAAALNDELKALDADYRTGLASCEQKTVIVTHPAFGYITDTYGLTQVGISGFDEDTEPSPARLVEVGNTAREAHATTIFFANTSSPKVAEVLADDLGLKTEVLSTLTAPAEGEDYLDMSRDNLAALRTGLVCS